MNIQKTPLSRSLANLIQKRAAAEIAKRWVELPGQVVSVSGSIVTVSFNVPGLLIPQATMPVAMSKYAQIAIKVGDLGVARPSSAYIAQVSGLGTGSPAAAALQPNMSCLVWEPVSSEAWDSDPANTVFTDASGAAALTLSATGITLAFGGHSVSIASAGVSIDGALYLEHEHSAGTYVAGDTDVTGDSGAVT